MSSLYKKLRGYAISNTPLAWENEFTYRYNQTCSMSVVSQVNGRSWMVFPMQSIQRAIRKEALNKCEQLI